VVELPAVAVRIAGKVYLEGDRPFENGVRRGSGHRAVALFYSLIESAKLVGVESRAYLGEATRQAIRCPWAVTLARDFK
jgi:hypothetical protein